jgi:hypothetical protein
MIAITTDPATATCDEQCRPRAHPPHFTLERMTNDYLELFLPDAV